MLPELTPFAKQTGSEPPRFLADGMLGRLARWLRLLGYDTLYDRTSSDLELARRARGEGRILLTRDRELARRRGLRVLLIRSTDLAEQLQELERALGLSATGVEGHTPQPRCSLCNLPLQRLRPAQAADRVPPYVMRTQRVFYCCPRCGRMYWSGTHVAAMRRQLRGLSRQPGASVEHPPEGG